MRKHSDYITHLKNEEDVVYLKSKHFPVNMRLFETSPEYKAIILQQCDYIRRLCLDTKEGYKKPHGMSSANAGLAFNIIGITRNRNKHDEYCEIMINPVITRYFGDVVNTLSNCGSLTLPDKIVVYRYKTIRVSWYNEEGVEKNAIFGIDNNSFTIQHEVDHNLGILITDKSEL
jgi:peptide deformylase